MLNLHIIPVSAFQQNCAIIWDDNGSAAVIDAGGEPEKIIQFVESQQLKVEKLLITHGHLDHIMAVEALKAHFKVDVFGSSIEDKPLFEQLPQICRQYGLPDVSAFLPDHWLSEGDSVQVGSLNFSVRHLPGHSPGHIGFFDFDHQVVFSGDVLFQNSIGRTDLYGGNFEQLIQTIQQKLFDLPEDFVVMSGHGQPTTIGEEKRHNPFLT